LLRALGDEFQSRGWSDDSDLALKITHDAQTLRRLDANAAATLASRGFLLRNRTSRAKLRGALASVFAGRTLLDPDLDHPHTMPAPQHTNITIGDGNTGVNINVGGQQVNVTAQSSKDDVLAGVAALVRAALQGEVPATQFAQLDQLISARNDLEQKDIETVTAEIVEQAAPPPSKLTQLRNSVITSAGSGLLVQGIIAVLNSL
jgi:DNA-binding NarL/FixJ family response regulator